MIYLRTSFCSDTLSSAMTNQFAQLVAYFKSLPLLNVDASSAVNFPQTPNQKSDDFAGSLSDPRSPLIVDVTGGNSAMETLRHFMNSSQRFLSSSNRPLYWSMSDNCLFLNALLDRSDVRILHGQSMTLVGKDSENQRRRFQILMESIETQSAFPVELIPPIVPVRGNLPLAEAFGGNLRAVSQLAETPWFPQAKNRVLVLEAWSPTLDLVKAYWNKILESGKMDGIVGVVVGKMTKLQETGDFHAMVDFIGSTLPSEIPVALTPFVGHGSACWTIPFGEPLQWRTFDA